MSTVYLCVLAGQSNMEGRVTRDSVIDVDVTGAYQFVGYSGNANYRTIQSDITPLLHKLGFTDVTAPADRFGPGEHVCRQLLTDNPTATAILLVPCAEGSTAMASGTAPLWSPGATAGSGGTLFENMVTQANLAYTAAQTMWPGATIVVQIYWSQGEQDANNGCSQSTYYSTLQNFITDARSRITGATSAPFIIGSMIPQLWTIGDPHYNSNYAAINAAHVQASLNVTGAYYCKGGDTTSSSDGLHYSPVAVTRTYGDRLAQVLSDTTGPSMTGPTSTSTTVSQQLSFSLTGNDGWGHQTFHINGGTDAAKFQISDPYLTPTLQWVGNGNGPAPGTYSVGLRARDGSGNYGATVTYTVTVATSEVSPTTFFTSSEHGMVWDLSNLANLSQTIDGLTPVTATGQSVGWVKDLSPNANHWIAAANDTTRPTYQVDTDGKPYLSFNGTNQVVFAGTPYIKTPTAGGSGIHTACVGLFGAAPAATKAILCSHSTTNSTPFMETFLTSATGGNLTFGMRNNASSGAGTLPIVTGMLDNATKRVMTAAYNGSNANVRMRDAAARPNDGGASAGYSSLTQGTFANDLSLTRSSLGATGSATPGAFFSGRVYSGFAIGRYLTDSEVKNGEEWVNNRTRATSLPGQATVTGGTSQGTGAATATGVTIAASSGTASGQGSAAAVGFAGSSASSTTGTAAGHGSAQATGTAIKAASGTAHGTGSLSGVGRAVRPVSGAPGGIGTAHGTGVAVAAASGTALGVGAAQAIFGTTVLYPPRHLATAQARVRRPVASARTRILKAGGGG